MVTSKTLRDTSDFLSSISKKKNFEPTNLELVYYILAKDFGITINKVIVLPIPYLLSLINSRNYIVEEENKANKQSIKKK